MSEYRGQAVPDYPADLETYSPEWHAYGNGYEAARADDEPQMHSRAIGLREIVVEALEDALRSSSHMDAEAMYDNDDLWLPAERLKIGMRWYRGYACNFIDRYEFANVLEPTA